MKGLGVSVVLLLSYLCQGSVAAADAVKLDVNENGVHSVEDGSYVAPADVAQDPLLTGSMPFASPYDTSRHRQEKAHLLKRMAKKSGKWTTTHPRYRLLEALFAYSKYRERNMAELDRWRTLYQSVSKKQKKTLEKTIQYTKKLDDIEELIYTNEAICKNIVMHAMEFYQIPQDELDEHMSNAAKDNRVADKMSVVQSLKHYVRDWSDEGVKERNQAFPCILDTLEQVKISASDQKPLKVLLPGSGLGRLSHDVANLGGFEVTMNEWSMYMNVAYRFIEAQTATTDSSFTIHPFVDGMSHHATTTDMLRPINAPDILPNPKVLLVEGDFNTAFNGHEGTYDVLVTHYFIDTARNLMAYFDTIHRLLKPGGTWINFGPLLYGTGPFVQLSLNEILAVIEEMGFEFEAMADSCGARTFGGKNVFSMESEYGFNGKALTRNAYLAQAWVVRRR